MITDNKVACVHDKPVVFIPDNFGTGSEIDIITGTSVVQKPVRIRFNEKLPVGRSVNQAMDKISESDKPKFFGLLLDYIFKGEPGYEFVIRSCYLHFMMTVTPNASKALGLFQPEICLVTVWIKVPRVFHFCGTYFRSEFEDNGLLYVLGKEDAVEEYINLICEKFWISHAALDYQGSKIHMPN